MNIKNYLLLSIAASTASASAGRDDIWVSAAPSNECTGKVAKKRLPLFIAAEKNEQHFTDALTECKKNNTCESCAIFEQESRAVAFCLIELANHLNELENRTDGTCKVCERNEAKDLKDRLNNLLNNPEAKHILLKLAQENH